MKIGLRIEVATLRGTREAVPRLVAILKEHRARATFLLALGPDRTGRALDSLPPVPKLKCDGLRAVLSGTLLPAPDIGLRCAGALRALPQDGHEAGILAYDRAAWVNRVAGADEAWTAAAMQRARERYEEIFGVPALTHGAPGWRTNRYVYRCSQRLGFRHCSDTRGPGPFIPVIRGEVVACPQIPTTLPTLDELVAGGLDVSHAVQRLLAASGEQVSVGHVVTLRAEVEGTIYAPALQALLAGWRALGAEVVPLRDYATGLELSRLPRRVVENEKAAGGAVAVAGKEFLADSIAASE
jgi:undecaprenyl phosphate-alpha-L-ara4FN deformylase